MTQAPDSAARDPFDGDDSAPAEPDALEPERREWLLGPEHHQQRIDKTLAVLAAEFSRSHLQQVIAQGHVALDGSAVTGASRRVRAGQ
ncbi:MAG TPA: S4 domain-containing protein, partial [Burkholderiaceae bacterium]